MVRMEAASNSSGLVTPLGNASVEERRNLTDRSPVDPSILPEQGMLAIADCHGSGGEEERALLGSELEVEACPRLVGVRAAEPKPPCAQREAGAREVADAKATKRDRASNSLPVDVAVPAVCLHAPGLEEATLDLLERLDGLLGGCQC